MDVVEQDITLSEFAVLQFYVMELCYLLMKSTFIQLTLKWPRGLGGGCHPQQFFFQFFSRMGRAFIPNKIFSCRLVSGTSFHQKLCQIGSTVLALKLDKGRVLGVATISLPRRLFFTYFSNYEDGIKYQQILIWSKMIPR